MKRMMRIKACIAASLTLCLLLAGHVMSVRAAAPDTKKAPVSENSYPVFDFESKTVKLNSGYDMPILGLGMFALSDSQAENSTYWALKAGFRLIDTARIYGNEAAVGRGLQKAIEEGVVTRDEVFITTKMWTSDFDNGDAAVDASLEALGVDYIDLMILHHSQPSNDVDAYQAMERAVEAGKLRSIGLSNYYEPEDFDRLVNATAIKPALLQNETHPYHQSGLMKGHIAQYRTVLESWFPLGGMKAAATTWKERRARINTISPGVIVTPLAYDEFAAAGEGYQKMVDASAAERCGTSDEIAEAGAFLLGEHAGFITGTDLLIDGGVIAAIRTGTYSLRG